MSFFDPLLIDILSGESAPSNAFGAPLHDVVDTTERFRGVVATSRSRIRKFFHVALDTFVRAPEQLEAIIRDIWQQGWGSDDCNLSLMTTDLGSVFADSLAVQFNGQFVFRSPTNMAHTSLWWPDNRVEAFPFHKMHERLTIRDSEPLNEFATRLRDTLAS